MTSVILGNVGRRRVCVTREKKAAGEGTQRPTMASIAIARKPQVNFGTDWLTNQ
jgi:hypothetical protein